MKWGDVSASRGGESSALRVPASWDQAWAVRSLKASMPGDPHSHVYVNIILEERLTVGLVDRL